MVRLKVVVFVASVVGGAGVRARRRDGDCDECFVRARGSELHDHDPNAENQQPRTVCC